LPSALTDAALEAQLFTAVGTKQGHRRRAEPDWAALHRELKRKYVTLEILWDEYIERFPEGCRYSRFCELCRGWAPRISVTMRQTHAGGDKLFVGPVEPRCGHLKVSGVSARYRACADARLVTQAPIPVLPAHAPDRRRVRT
jgi:hypothetical protein